MCLKSKISLIFWLTLKGLTTLGNRPSASSVIQPLSRREEISLVKKSECNKADLLLLNCLAGG